MSRKSDAKRNNDGYRTIFCHGNQAVVEGALAAGCRFFGGYPITPSTEIAEGMARRLPLVGGVFIQMEDEIGSIASIIGASAAGKKSMTATSGPGFSLMQENLGYAYIAELPTVIVDVQRGGPSTGLPTMMSQSDTMQARWGTHGDYTAIAFAPSSVQEIFYETIRAFNTAEKFSTPVILLLDEMLGHMKEKVIIPPEDEIEIFNRPNPEMPPEWYFPYEETPDYITHPAPFGMGFRYNITGLIHDKYGFPTARSEEIIFKLEKMRKKIMFHIDEISKVETLFMDDALYAVIAYGSTARAAKSAVMTLRSRGMRVGLVQLYTVWPFPDDLIYDVAKQVRSILVPELNMGQLVLEVQRVAQGKAHIHSLTRYDGRMMTPAQIIKKIEEVR